MDQDYELIKVLAQLFQSELELDPIQVPGADGLQPRVFIYNQKWDIPPIEGIFLEVGFLFSKSYCATLEYKTDPDSGDLLEAKSANVQEAYSVTAFSRNGEARQRHHELPMALRSTACQQLAERYSFKVGYIPFSAVDASETEASAILNKYVYSFAVLRVYSKCKPVPFFDKFNIPPNPIV